MLQTGYNQLGRGAYGVSRVSGVLGWFRTGGASVVDARLGVEKICSGKVVNWPRAAVANTSKVTAEKTRLLMYRANAAAPCVWPNYL